MPMMQAALQEWPPKPMSPPGSTLEDRSPALLPAVLQSLPGPLAEPHGTPETEGLLVSLLGTGWGGRR